MKNILVIMCLIIIILHTSTLAFSENNMQFAAQEINNAALPPINVEFSYINTYKALLNDTIPKSMLGEGKYDMIPMFVISNKDNAAYIVYTDTENYDDVKVKDIYKAIRKEIHPVDMALISIYFLPFMVAQYGPVFLPITIPIGIAISPIWVATGVVTEAVADSSDNRKLKKELKSKYNMNTVVYSRDANTGIEIPPNSTAVIYSFNHHIYLYNTETQIMYIYAGNKLQEYNKQEHKKYAPPYIPKSKQQKVD